ncbi:hypothetical protein HK100_001410 [Physocladia obscura]|uniref:Delta(14)-sterol reductase ERG24 n=1 Tax=Physocladia obscura TaxID=109957 RepID=A0AAD5SYL7_9FUNG|nr:hypothetical protein HK100_001410 [Physocladia obscura]
MPVKESKKTAVQAVEKSKEKRVRNPRTRHFEFLGPHLTPVFVFVMCVFPTIINALCVDGQCPPAWLTEAVSFAPFASLSAPAGSLVPAENATATYARTVGRLGPILPTAIAVVAAWYAWQAALYMLLPGRVITGSLVRDGSRLRYPINAFSAFVASYMALAAACAYYGPAPLLWVANNNLALCVASTLLSVLQSVLLYAASFRSVSVGPSNKTRVPALLAVGGNSGYPIYDFFIGRELNPRFYSFDIKYFCELRPGLIGWSVLNAANAIKQGVVVSASSIDSAAVSWPLIFSSISNSMWLVLIFQLYYVIDAVWNEPAILTTMDITTDGFGFMLNYGDLVWVPFTYSLQSKYLAMASPRNLSYPVVAAILAIKLLGLTTFRGANSQKNAFRTDPNGPETKHLKSIQTKRGTRLLVSGWWGTARHINYTGDWLMALSWSLPVGLETAIPYFYPFYFAILLFHREIRDEHSCKEKYGDDWDKYRSIVKYRFIPGIY